VKLTVTLRLTPRYVASSIMYIPAEVAGIFTCMLGIKLWEMFSLLQDAVELR